MTSFTTPQNGKSVSHLISAIDTLMASDVPDKSNTLRTILENPKQPDSIRHYAVINLGRLKNEESLKILLKNLSINDKVIVDEILITLGYVGDVVCLQYLVNYKNALSTQKCLSTAISLLSYRLGLPEHSLDSSKITKTYINEDYCKELTILRLTKLEIKKYLDRYLDEYVLPFNNVEYGFNLRFDEPDENILLLLNSESPSLYESTRLLESNNMIAQVLTYDRVDEGFFLEYLLLSNPLTHATGKYRNRNETEILVITPDDLLICGGGTMKVFDESIEIMTSWTSSDELFPFYLNFRIDQSGVSITDSRYADYLFEEFPVSQPIQELE